MATPNLQYANSASNYCVIIMLQNLTKVLKSKISKKNSHSRDTKCRCLRKTCREATWQAQRTIYLYNCYVNGVINRSRLKCLVGNTQQLHVEVRTSI